MKRYLNIGGNSGVRYYEIGKDFIIVEFSDGGQYLYTYKSTGNLNVERMKSLAVNGKGLNSFISTTVKKNYEQKLK